MRKVGDALGSYPALDCEWMRRNPQSPWARASRETQHRERGIGRGPVPSPPCCATIHRGTLFPHTSAQAVKQLLLLQDFLYPSGITLERVLLISCTNIIIPITPFLTFAQCGGGRTPFFFFLLSAVILPQTLCFWSYGEFIVGLINFLGAIPGHNQCIYVCQILYFHVLCLKIEMVSAKQKFRPWNFSLG